jgi:hypothetical protein
VAFLFFVKGSIGHSSLGLFVFGLSRDRAYSLLCCFYFFWFFGRLGVWMGRAETHGEGGHAPFPTINPACRLPLAACR